MKQTIGFESGMNKNLEFNLQFQNVKNNCKFRNYKVELSYLLSL